MIIDPGSTIVQPGPMVIAPSRKKLWVRDPVIQEMIDYFDQPDHNSLDKLKTKEFEAITEQVQMCGDDFTYCARNYFWISTKRGEDTLFGLWESQEIILDKLMMLRARGKAQKLIVLKARQLGASTLIEALIAWTAMFFPNTNSIVASYNEDHAAHLFGIMTHIYDHMPWWLRPMKASGGIKTGIKFDNPDENARRLHPGMNSEIAVQYATQYTGLGTGRRITGAHLSELGLWQQKTAKSTVEGDMREALAEDSPLSFAIIESTGRGAGSYYHHLYKTQKDLGDGKQEWFTVFLPWFFETSRFIAPEGGWHPEKPELELRERAQRDWVRCDFSDCSMWHESNLHHKSWLGETCPHCKTGTLKEFVISDAQLRFIYSRRVNSESDKEAMNKLRQELASTDTEAWQLSGHQTFNETLQDYVEQSKQRPRIRGFIDKSSRIHGVMVLKLDPKTRTPVGSQCWCSDCNLDHSFDDAPLQIWRFPEKGARYSIGVDVSEGLGGAHDNSVIFVNKIGDLTGEDELVALFISNEIDPTDLAWPVLCLGRMYNEALVGIEVNKFNTTAVEVVKGQYPNCYRGVNNDGAHQVQARRLHWETKEGNKYKLWQMAVKWLKSKCWLIRSDEFLQEMKTFQKQDPSATNAEAMRGFKDDILMAGMIALFIAHEQDWDEETNTAQVRARESSPADNPYTMLCRACGHTWRTDDPSQFTDTSSGRAVGCIKCHSINLTGSGPKDDTVTNTMRGIYGMMSTATVAGEEITKYDEL